MAKHTTELAIPRRLYSSRVPTAMTSQMSGKRLQTPATEQSFPARSIPQYEYPVFRWMSSSNCFFAIHRPNKKTPSCISFYNGESGEKLDSIRLDPDELLPYDKEPYAKILREGYSLAIDESHYCVGYFLDVWSHIEFNQQIETLSLRTYRPSSAVYDRDDISTCDVVEKWVEITLKP